MHGEDRARFRRRVALATAIVLLLGGAVPFALTVDHVAVTGLALLLTACTALSSASAASIHVRLAVSTTSLCVALAVIFLEPATVFALMVVAEAAAWALARLRGERGETGRAVEIFAGGPARVDVGDDRFGAVARGVEVEIEHAGG